MSSAPNPSITLHFNGEDREIFMSFALLNRLTFLIGDIQQCTAILLVPEVRETVLEETLAKRDKKGKLIEAYKLDEMEISLEDILRVQSFIVDHLMSFFMKASDLGVTLTQKYTSQAQVMQDKVNQSSSIPTPNGPVDSASKTPAA